MRSTRRTFLGAAAAAALPVTSFASVTSDPTPDDLFRHHYDGLLAAMKALHPECDQPFVRHTDDLANLFICMGKTRAERAAKEAADAAYAAKMQRQSEEIRRLDELDRLAEKAARNAKRRARRAELREASL